MADQGAVIITMAIPASTARGSVISGAGTLSATLRGAGVVVEGTSSTETKGAVQIGGTALAIFGATITAGQTLQAAVTGKLVDCTDGELCCAIALEGGADGELRKVKII